MPFNWIQSRIKKNAQGPDPSNSVEAHQATSTVLGPVPWTVWHDSGLELVCEAGRDKGTNVPLDLGFAVIGRGRDDSEPRDGWILFTEDTVSRRQAILCWNDEKSSYYLHHLAGATNATSVDRRSGDQWRVGVGSSVEMGHLRFRIQRRLLLGGASAFVLGALQRFGRRADDGHVQTGYALTLTNGPHKGRTWLLTRTHHVLHTPLNESPARLLDRGQPSDLEQDVLVWNEAEQAYELVHNDRAQKTLLQAGTPTLSFDLFAAPTEPRVEARNNVPVLLAPGDTIHVGPLSLRLHRHAQCLLDGSIEHIRKSGFIEQIPAVDVLIATAKGLPLRVEAPRLAPTLSPGEAPRAVREERPRPATPAKVPRRKGGKNRPPAAAATQAPEPASVPASPPEPPPFIAQEAPASAEPTVEVQAAPTLRTAPRSAEAPIRAYELEVLTVPGRSAGERLRVGDETRVDVGTCPRVTIGTSDDSLLVIQGDESLSAAHAAIEITEHGLVLRPLDGVSMVNRSICLKEAALRHGDEIRFSRNTLVRLHAVD